MYKRCANYLTACCMPNSSNPTPQKSMMERISYTRKRNADALHLRAELVRGNDTLTKAIRLAKTAHAKQQTNADLQLL